MSKEAIAQLIQIARAHIERRMAAPVAGDPTTPEPYFAEIHSELEEAMAELTKDNVVYLEDELGDIFWDYCLLLSYLENQGYIDSVDAVFAQSVQKYQERAPAMRARSQEQWNTIKHAQKDELARRHMSRYGAA